MREHVARLALHATSLGLSETRLSLDRKDSRAGKNGVGESDLLTDIFRMAATQTLVRSLMLISTLAEATWSIGAGMDDALKLQYEMSDALQDFSEVEAEAVCYASRSAWLIPGTPAKVLADKPCERLTGQRTARICVSRTSCVRQLHTGDPRPRVLFQRLYASATHRNSSMHRPSARLICA